MSKLVYAALTGTSRQPLTLDTTPEMELIRNMEGITPERQLLLAAGASALAKRAGTQTQPAPKVAVAPDEALPEISEAASALLQNLVTKNKGQRLLPEALRRIRSAGLRVPPYLLPDLLNLPAEDVRQIVPYVIGERGRWLAELRPEWAWAAKALSERELEAADAQQQWEEGTSAQRLGALRRVRGRDAAMAREWIENVWKSEKAEFRAELVWVLEAGLAPDDEPFLESALDDRARAVRVGAAKLLALLPNSSLSARMRERAAKLIASTHSNTGNRLGRLARAVTGSREQLHITFPKALDETAEHDGLQAKPPTSQEPAAWWFHEIVSRVPPTYWEQRLDVERERLLDLACRNEHGPIIIQAWTDASFFFKDLEWFAPLWRVIYERRELGSQRDRLPALIDALISSGNISTAERLISERLSNLLRGDDAAVYQCMLRLPTPWSPEFSERFLENLKQSWSGRRQPSYHWTYALDAAALALHKSAFPAALELLRSYTDREQNREETTVIKRAMQDIVTRHQIAREIPL